MKAKWLNDPRFNNIDEKKKAYLISMLEQMEGKPMNAAMQAYMQTSSKMKAEGLSLTQSEAQLMIEYLMENMSPQEKIKWNKIREYINKKQ
ncbi:MAG: hypothetical protein ACI39R_00700 [Lachnospiraceae bacterium]